MWRNTKCGILFALLSMFWHLEKNNKKKKWSIYNYNSCSKKGVRLEHQVNILRNQMFNFSDQELLS